MLINLEVEIISRFCKSLKAKAVKISVTFLANFSTWLSAFGFAANRMKMQGQHIESSRLRRPGIIKFMFIFEFSPAFMFTLIRFWLF